jgi:hypothetical protein
VCLKLVRDLFTQWFRVKQKQNENPDDVDDQDLSQMATARDCLKQLFADRLGFDSAESFMGTATSANDPKVIKQLMSWTTEIYRMFIEDGETSVHFTSATPEDLTEQYHPFTRECANARMLASKASLLGLHHGLWLRSCGMYLQVLIYTFTY